MPSSLLRAHRGISYFLMIRRPPRSTRKESSAASDVYKRQVKVAEEAYHLYKSIGHAEENVYSILEKLEAKKFQWGESDGN